MRTIPLLALMLLPACTVGPDYAAPKVATASAFVEPAAAGAPDVRWWTAFGDPTLVRLVEAARSANLDIAAADARIVRARAASAAARADAFPQLDATGTVTAQRLSENGVQLANIPRQFQPQVRLDQYRSGFDASWEIDLFGHNRRQREGAAARLGSAEEDRHDTLIRITAEVARNYAAMRAAEARLAIARAAVASNRQTLQLVNARVASGEEAPLEQRRVASDVAQAEASLPSLEADRRAALYALDVLIGEQPGAAARIVEGTPAVELVVPPVPTGLPSDMLRRRPDIRRAERNLAAATADVGVAVADLYPRFSLIGGLGLESVQPGDFLKAASGFWQVGPQISLPLFDGGRRRAVVRQRRASADEALAAYRSSVVQALSEVETAILRLNQERERFSRLEAARGELGETLALTQRRYRAGDTDLLDVLDVQRRVITLDDATAQSRAAMLTDAIALAKALGGGWEAPGSGGQ